MRVIGGSAKGRRLSSLKGQRVRPTLGRARETLFDILAPRIEGSRFLDLYAGVGTVGIEALSRGAAYAAFVETDPQAVAVLTSNVEKCGFLDRARVIRRPVRRAGLGALREEPFDIVFADPPYRAAQELEALLRDLGERGGLLRAGGLLVIQRPARQPTPNTVGRFWKADSRKFGDTILDFYRDTKDTEDEASAVRGQL